MDDAFQIDRITKATALTLHVSRSPVITLDSFLPILPDTVQVTVDDSQRITWILIKGVVASKSGERTARPNKVWMAHLDKNVPEWLRGEIRNAILNDAHTPDTSKD